MVRASKRGFTLLEIMVVVLILGLILAIAVPNFVKAKEKSNTQACVATLREINTAILQWAMHNGKSGNQPVTMTDLTSGAEPYLISTPECPSGGDYLLTIVDENPTCSIGGTHVSP